MTISLQSRRLKARIGALISQLPAEPAESDLKPLVEAILEVSSRSPQPLSSAAALLRRLQASLGLSDALKHQLRTLIRSESTSRQPTSKSDIGQWVHLTHAAAILCVDPARLRGQMRFPQFRKLYGWPQWRAADQDDWWFVLAAISPSTAADLAGSLGACEPWGLLPPTCFRVEQVDMRAAPGDP